MRGSINEVATASSLHVAPVPGRAGQATVEPKVLNTHRNRLAISALAVIALVALGTKVLPLIGARAPAAEEAALTHATITYDRSPVAEGVFASVATGDLAGRWVVTLVAGVDSPEVFNGELNWTFIGEDPSQSFVALLKGTHNHLTNAIVFDGTIVSGYMLGARVEDRGSLSGHGTAAMKVSGAMRIYPEDTPSSR